MSDLAMANVKALASGESGSFNCWWDSVDCRICYVGGYWLGCPCGSRYTSKQKNKGKNGKYLPVSQESTTFAADYSATGPKKRALSD